MSRAKTGTAPTVSATWNGLVAMIEPCAVVQFTVPGEPVPKERPRFGKEGQVFTPRKTTDAETAVGWRFRNAARGWQMDVLSQFGVMCLFQCGTYRHRDVDNLLKLVLDALNLIAWKDDSQVRETATRVVYGAQKPGTDVLIYRIPQEGA